MITQDGKHYLYRHTRIDTNELFYIGVGTKPKTYRLNTTEYSRAYTKKGRSNFWRNIVEKTDYEVEILIESNDYDFLKQKEIEFIALYGRRNLGKGTLVNLTDGGDGNLNGIVSKETRLKRSNALKGKTRSKETRENIIKSKEHIIASIKEAEVGKIYKMNQGFFVKVLDYKGSREVLVEILITGERITRSLTEIKKGSIKDYSLLTSNGKGYLGKRGYSRKETLIWRSFKRKYENIYGICDNWLSFEIFIKWYNENKRDNFCLVTHLLEEKGACDESNTYFLPSQLHRILLPSSGYWISPKGKIRLNFMDGSYGIFSSKLEAIEKHKEVKKAYIVSLVEEYKNHISIELYNKIINYKIKVLEDE